MRSRRKAFTLTVAFILAIFVVFIQSDRNVSENVMSGKTELFCNFKDGFRAVDKDMVKGFDSDFGWVFHGGGNAKNCEEREKGDL